MFQFSPLASLPLFHSGRDDEASPSPGFPIRAPPDQRLRAAPRGFSQLVAPFFACPCQGIHRAPFVRLTGYLYPVHRSSLDHALVLSRLSRRFPTTQSSTQVFNQPVRGTPSAAEPS